MSGRSVAIAQRVRLKHAYGPQISSSSQANCMRKPRDHRSGCYRGQLFNILPKEVALHYNR